MSTSKGSHLTKGNREVIEKGVLDAISCRKIATMIDVSPSTVLREVRANRTIIEKWCRPGSNVAP